MTYLCEVKTHPPFSIVLTCKIMCYLLKNVILYYIEHKKYTRKNV